MKIVETITRVEDSSSPTGFSYSVSSIWYKNEQPEPTTIFAVLKIEECCSDKYIEVNISTDNGYVTDYLTNSPVADGIYKVIICEGFEVYKGNNPSKPKWIAIKNNKIVI